MKHRTLKSIVGASAGIAIACPNGRKVRVLSIIADVSGATLAEQLAITFVRSNVAIVSSATEQLSGTEAQVDWFIGADRLAPLLRTIDPVTGDATYANGPVFAIAPLPDMWMSFDIVIAFAVASATLSNINVHYEEADET